MQKDSRRTLNSDQSIVLSSLLFGHGSAENSSDTGPIGANWLLIGRNIEYRQGQTIDFLGLDINGSLLIVNATHCGRDNKILVETLDAAYWTSDFTYSDLDLIYQDFADGQLPLDCDLQTAFIQKFNRPLNSERCNSEQQLVMVVDEIDTATECAVYYLSKSVQLNINVLFFSASGQSALKRCSFGWLQEVDVNGFPVVIMQQREREFCICLENDAKWQAASHFGFISTEPNGVDSLLAEGDRVWAAIAGKGYVGVGVITDGYVAKNALFQLSASEIGGKNKPLLKSVKWLHTLPPELAVMKKTYYSNNYPVFIPDGMLWKQTVKSLKRAWGL